MMVNEPYILIADDDPDDQELFEERLLRINPDAKIETVNNGMEALAFLRDRPAEALPKVIVVDYKMPGFTGYDFLVAIKNDPRYQAIPKVVWSTSNNQEYVQKSMEGGAMRFITKPNDVRGFDQLVGEIDRLYQA
ncbi:MAG TPA: response regulator [Puia sp.]|nr:response regulator [Puia sp.]